MTTETAPPSAAQVEPVIRRPIAWGCRTCNKIDWADTIEQLASPEHVSHRGVDIGSCRGKMIPLFDV
jgi:hypothetical protein